MISQFIRRNPLLSVALTGVISAMTMADVISDIGETDQKFWRVSTREP